MTTTPSKFDGAEEGAHRVDGGTVGAELVATADPRVRADRRRLGRPHELERDVAIGVQELAFEFGAHHRGSSAEASIDLVVEAGVRRRRSPVSSLGRRRAARPGFHRCGRSNDRCDLTDSGPTRRRLPRQQLGAPGRGRHAVTAVRNSQAGAAQRSSRRNSRVERRDRPPRAAHARRPTAARVGPASIPPRARTAAAVSTPSGAPPMPDDEVEPAAAARRAEAPLDVTVLEELDGCPCRPSLGREPLVARPLLHGDAHLACARPSAAASDAVDDLGDRGARRDIRKPGHVLLEVVRGTERGERTARSDRDDRHRAGRAAAASRVPSTGSTARSTAGPRPVPNRSPTKSIGRLVLLALADDDERRRRRDRRAPRAGHARRRRRSAHRRPNRRAARRRAPRRRSRRRNPSTRPDAMRSSGSVGMRPSCRAGALRDRARLGNSRRLVANPTVFRRSSHAHRHPRAVRRDARHRQGEGLRLPRLQRVVLADPQLGAAGSRPRRAPTASSRSPRAAPTTSPATP